jgi:sensor histidine kinase YesM
MLGVWVGLGLLEAAKAYLSRRLAGNPVSWSTVLVGNLPWWLMWAALTPVCIALARRARPRRRNPAPLLLHMVAAIGLSLIHHVVVGSLYYFTHTRGTVAPIGGALAEMTLARQYQGFFAEYFVLNVLTYGAIVAGYLSLEFYKRYRERELHAAQLEVDMHAARLAALRMELNPHFLFNTLNAVAGLVRQQRSDEAIEMLARLADLLRSTLEEARDAEIPLEKELELLCTYLEIERIRFGDRLTIEVDAETAAQHAMVPPLILQPLVENAVRHGVARHEGPALIRVYAREQEGVLRIAVTNTGPASIDVAAASDRSGIGLENTRERLRHYFGSDGAELELRSLPGGGAQATIVARLRPVANAASRPMPGPHPD